ncbi:MAG: hypothetical protein ACJAZW_000332 [Maritalea sp.]|jgi:hypothetical protein
MTNKQATLHLMVLPNVKTCANIGILQAFIPKTIQILHTIRQGAPLTIRDVSALSRRAIRTNR